MNNKKASVLCIDDELLFRRLLVDYLEDAGYTVRYAENGLKGLQAFRANPPDMTLVDLRMPEMDGFEVLSAIHLESPETPVVVVSGVDGMQEAIRALRLGAWNFISKPITDMAILDHVLTDALEKARLIRENRIYKEHLERMVQEKTRALESTNEYLHHSLQKLEQEIEERKRIEQALHRTRNELETRVRERTEDLLKANLQLKKESEERLAAVESLRRSEEKYRMIAENVSDIIWTMDIDRFKYTYISPSIKRVRGYTPQEAMQMPLETMMPQASYNQLVGRLKMEIDEARKKKSQNVHSIVMELQEYNKDGETIWSEMTANFLFDNDHRPTGILGLSRNITDRKKAEKDKIRLEMQLRQTQKIESLGTLAGGIAHDFNNLLYPIVGYTEMTMDDIDEDSVARTNLEEILKAAYRAKALVQQILTFSRQSDQDKRPVEVQSVVREAMKLLRATLPTTVVVRQDIAENCGPIFADPTQIHQVMINLCTNAYHAMRERGGILEVSVSEIELHPKEVKHHPELFPGGYVQIIIKDNGRGIDPEIIDRIFEPYFTTKNPGEGTGMGLAVTHGIIKGCKGKIWVESQLGQGTTVSIHLPLYKNQSVAPHEAGEAVIESGREHILLVDDEEQIALMVQQMLERIGYRVTAFTDSLATLKTFEDHPDDFDLVITDMTMPHLAGDQLALKIKSLRQDLPIVLCSGFSEAISEEKAMSIGISAFIMKPVIKKEMARIVRKVLDRN